jgi:hypothetical protein
MYCLTYCINIYILFCYVVELYALRGAEGWWGSQLAWIRNSLIIHVRGFCKVSPALGLTFLVLASLLCKLGNSLLYRCLIIE